MVVRVLQAAVIITRLTPAALPPSRADLQPVYAQVDGREYGLLRKTPRLAFGLCLLYIWLQMMGAGGVKWWTFWRDALYAYSRCCSAAPCSCNYILTYTSCTSSASCSGRWLCT